MPQFREKPKVIEARLFAGSTSDLMAVVSWIQSNGYVWFDMFTPAPGNGITIDAATGFLNIMTPEGLMMAQQGMHYMVKDVSGKIRPMPKAEFEATFEEVIPEPEPEPEPAP